MRVFRAPGGEGPYGITTTPSGDVLRVARGQLPRPDRRAQRARDRAEAAHREPGRPAGLVRLAGRVWISEWNAGRVGMYDPRGKRWREWRVPGANPMIYAVFVDDRDQVWLSDFGANALVRFDPATGRFTRVPLPSPGPPYGRSWGEGARSGARSPARTSSSSSARGEGRAARGRPLLVRFGRALLEKA